VTNELGGGRGLPFHALIREDCKVICLADLGLEFSDAMSIPSGTNSAYVHGILL
jgi:hypothetical protein